MKNNIFKKLEKILSGVQKNVLLKNYTTFEIGGPAKYFFVAKSKEDLVKAVKLAKKLKLPIFILGGGSNLLVSDKGFKGLVIKMQNEKIKIKNDNAKSKMIHVDAGAALSALVGFAAENSFKGFEWAVGIPGATVGGAIFGHAQAFGEKISDEIENVGALDIKTLKVKNLTKKQCRFSLKDSIFKKNRNLIIISAVFKLKKKDKKEIQKKIAGCLNYRKKRHPMTFPSAGSVFVNPEVKINLPRRLLERFPELKEFVKKRVIPAGYLIEKCGLKGKKIGKAQISEKHANFIINLGGAKAKDVLKLIKLAKKTVKKSFGINLEEEIQYLGG
jgi:UDP-N-acetylmuramate dehydrogenase